MSDEKKGYKLVLKINLPPEVQYHSGHSLLVQGDSGGEVQHALAELIAGPEASGKDLLNVQDQARFILLRFVEYAQQRAVEAGLKQEVPTQGTSTATGTEMPQPPAAPGQADGKASAALLKVVAKKTGKSVEELGELTTARAKEIIQEGK